MNVFKMIHRIAGDQGQNAKPGSHPVFELIAIRGTLSTNAKYVLSSQENMILDQIPIADKEKMKKLFKSNDPATVLNQYIPRFKFQPNILKLLHDSKLDPKETNDIYACAVCFLAFEWLYIYKVHESTDFALFVEMINRINSPLFQNVVNFTFDELIRIGMDTKDFKWTPEMYQNCLKQYYTNKTFEGKYLSRMMKLCQSISNNASPEVVSGMLVLVDELIIARSSIFNTTDVSPLISLIQPFIMKLNSSALLILAHITQLGNFSCVNETYMMIASSFVSFIEKSKQAFGTTIEDKPREPLKFNTQISRLKLEFIDTEYNEPFSFDYPQFSKFDENTNVAELLTPELKETGMSIGKCMQESSNSACETFIIAFFHLLTALSHTPSFMPLSFSFIYIFQMFYNQTLMELVFNNFQQTPIFSPHFTIFSEMEPLIDTTRSKIFRMVAEKMPLFSDSIIKSAAGFPLLLTEHITRILAHESQYDLSIFMDEKVLETIFISSIQLQKMFFEEKSENIKKARNSNLLFIFKLATNHRIRIKCITSKIFCKGLIYFMFDPCLTEAAIITVRNILADLKPPQTQKNLQLILENLTSVFEICTKNCQDPRYQRLAIDLAKAIKEAIAHVVQISYLFEPIIMPILNYLLAKPDPVGLQSILIILTLIAPVSRYFKLNALVMCKLSKVIKLVDNEEPSANTEAALFNLLSGSVCLIEGSTFVIKNPSILPLILIVFGCSKQLRRILERINSLCKYSEFNKQLCHDGDLDLILTQFLCTRSEESIINYRGYEFKIRLSTQDINAIVFPMVASISVVKSSNAIAYQFINHFIHKIDHPLSNYFGIHLAKCLSIPLPLFALGTEVPQFQVAGIFASDLNKGFSMHFMLNLDIEGLNQCNFNIRLISITDQEENRLVFFINRSTLYAKYESDYSRTTVYFAKNLATSTWIHFTILVQFMEDRVRLSTYKNTDKLNDSDLCEFTFSDGELKLVVGGVDSEDITDLSSFPDHQLSAISSLQLFDSHLGLSEIKSLIRNPLEMIDQTIFGTEMFNQQKTISIKRKEQIQAKYFGSAVTHITITRNDSLPSRTNILDAIVQSDGCNTIAQYFNYLDDSQTDYPVMIIGMIGQLFNRGEDTQRRFNMLDCIRSNLMNHPKLLTWELFNVIYDVNKQIKYDILHDKWFDSLVMNMWLWSQNEESFMLILHHWSHCLVFQNQALFIKHHYFGTLFTHYMIFFCNEHKFNDEARKLFLNLLFRVATVNLIERDLDIFFEFLIVCQSKEYQLELLNFLYNISEKIIQLDLTGNHYLEYLHMFFINDDLEINELALLCLHQLSYGNTYYHMITAATCFSAHANQLELFNKMRNRLADFPNLVPLLCIIALRLGDDSVNDLCAPLLLINHEKYTKEPLWYVWPVLLAFYSKEDANQTSICFFLADVLMSDLETFKSRFEQVLVFIFFIQNTTIFHDSPILFYFLETIITRFTMPIEHPNLRDILMTVIQSVFFVLFFQANKGYYHNNVKEALQNNPYGEFTFPTSAKIEAFTQMNDVASYESIELFDISKFDVYFWLKLNEENEWKDVALAERVMSITKTIEDDQEMRALRILIMFFMKSDLTSDSKNKILSASEDVLEKYRSIFNDLLKDNMCDIAENIKSNSELVHDILTKVMKRDIAPVKAKSDSQIELEKQRALKLSQLNPPSQDEYVRDNTTCSYLCPLRRKKKYHSTPDLTLSKPGDTLIEIPAEYVSFNKGKEDILVMIYKDRFALVAQRRIRTITFEQVMCIFHKRKYAVEFNLYDGRNYLIDFAIPDGHINFLKTLPKTSFQMSNYMKADSFIQRSFLQRWESGLMSNFEFIIKCNLYSGRSFNDMTLYPIFPLLIDDPAHPKQSKVNSPKAFDSVDKYLRSDAIQILPSWAQNKTEVVYKNRKKLEQPSVSKQVHEWINNFWGASSGNRSHYTLFTHAVNARRVGLLEQPSKCQFELSIEPNTIFACSQISREQMMIITSDGSIFNLDMNFGPQMEVNKGNTISTISIQKDHRFMMSSNPVLYGYSRINHSFTLIRNGQVISTVPLYTESSLMVATWYSLVYCSDSCTIKSISTSGEEVLCHSISPIVALEVSELFKLIVFATIDGNMHIHNLRNGKEEFVINVKEEIRRIIVTKIWGFIIAATDTRLMTFTCNGELIKEVPLDEEIIMWDTFVTVADFDYVVYVLKDHKIGFFEAYNPNMANQIYECPEGIIKIMFDKETGTFIFVTDGRSIKIFPHPIMD